jgi:protein ImuB
MRIICIDVPSFPLAAWWRVDPELRRAPLVITDAAGPRGRIVACAPELAQRGVGIGLTAAQAIAIDSAVVVRVRAPAAERAAQAALCDAAYSCSPRVEEDAPGTVYADADGLRALFASEADLAHEVARRIRKLGLEASIGIAATKIAARLAARDGGGVAVVPPHAEWQVLAPLPIHLLAPSAALSETLARWGIRTLGDLAALPIGALATRLGPEGVALAHRARGEDAHPLAPRSLPLHFEETAELEYGIETLEPALFVLRGLLNRLLARLALRGLVCGDLRLSLGLTGRRRDERTVTVAAPSNDCQPLLTLIRLHLEAQPPADAIETLRLAAIPERLRPMQLDLFRPNGPVPAQLAATLARLTALCGAEAVGAPAVVDSHRPDAYAVERFAPRPAVPANGPAPARTVALRAVRPPRRLEVFCNRDRPDFVRADGCTGRVVALAGPWRVQAEWWRPDAVHRDYYDAQLSDGGVYRLFFDRVQQEWFVDGSYD